MRYIKRNIEATLKRYLKIFPAVGVTGPRQSGKSTMLRKILGKVFRYVSFDDLKAVEFFHRDPEGFMDEYSEKVIFDEVQYVPEIFRYIKIKIDNNRDRRGNFIITGSSQFAFMRNVSESLAGRIGLLSLLPFEYSELPVLYRNNSIYLGSYPELVKLKYNNTSDWYTSYLNTYIERDVRSLSNIGDLRDFTSFVKLMASKISDIISMSDISRDLAVSVNTIKRWLSILEASYIAFLLPPYYKNIGKRLVKRPKLYFYDSGFAAYLTGMDNKNVFENNPLSGKLFENYIISEIIKRRMHSGLRPEMYYLRSSHGKEIDLIIQDNKNPMFAEIKYSSTFKILMLKNIESLIPVNFTGYLIYRGKNLDFKKINVVNYKNFLEDKN